MNQVIRTYLLAVLLHGALTPAWSQQGAASDAWERVVFHVDEKSNARWALMLARSYLDDTAGVQVVFVTYGPGIDFLLEDAEDRRGNPYDAAVQALAARGVDFRVCATTLSARDIAAEKLLVEATVVPSGISEIVRLQLKEGYAYLKP